MTIKDLTREIASTLVGCMLLASSVNAQEYEGQEQFVFKPVEVNWLLDIMRNEGYAADKDADGDIEWKIDGFKAWITFHKDETHLLFYSAFGDTGATLRKVNTWNSEVVFSRSYIDDDGDPIIEYPLRTKYGVTEEQAIDFLLLCREIFQDWYSDVVN